MDKAGDVSSRTAEVLRSLKLREDERKADLNRNKLAHREEIAATGSATDFFEAWRCKEEGVRSKLRAQQNSEAAKDELEELGDAISDLEKEAAGASFFLTIYHTEQMNASLKGLKLQLKAAQAVAAPKKKFTFSKKAAAKPLAASATSEKGSAMTTADLPVERPAVGSSNAAASAEPDTAGCSEDKRNGPPGNTRRHSESSRRKAKGLRGETIARTAEDLNGGDFSLEDLEGCTVTLMGQLSALRAHRLRRCRIFAGPVSGAAFFDELEECQLVVAAGQLRLHKSRNTDAYARVRSSPVVEACSDVRFGPLQLECCPSSFAGLLADANLAEENGSWARVQDFDWLRAAPSPHWRTLEAAERNQHNFLGS